MKLEATANELRIVVSLSLGQEAGFRLLAQADADHDANVTDNEVTAAVTAWRTALETELTANVDGLGAPIRWEQGYLSERGAVRRTPLVLEAVGHLALEPGVRRIDLVDAMQLGDVDRTDVAFRARDGVRILSSGPVSRSGGLTVGELAIGSGPLAGRHAVGMTVDVPGWSRSELRTVAIASALCAIVGVGVGVSAWRRRRRAAPTGGTDT